jgi:hypothetical protein
MSECSINPQKRILRRRAQVLGTSFFLVYLVSSQLALHFHDSAFGTALAVLSGISFFAELVVIGILVVRLRDEFQRILLAQSFLWATLITMALVTVWGFVELHSHGTAPHVPFLAIPVFLILATTAAKLLIFRQHRSPAL